MNLRLPRVCELVGTTRFSRASTPRWLRRLREPADLRFWARNGRATALRIHEVTMASLPESDECWIDRDIVASLIAKRTEYISAGRVTRFFQWWMLPRRRGRHSLG